MRFWEIASPPAKAVVQPNRSVVATRRFLKDLKPFLGNPEVIKTLRDFLAFRKTAKPTEQFGKKDAPFTNDKMRGFWHLHIVFGTIILIYQVTPAEVRLIAIINHKLLDVKNKNFPNWLESLTTEDFQPFDIDEISGHEEPEGLSQDQKQAVRDELYSMASNTEERQMLDFALKRQNITGLMPNFRFATDDDKLDPNVLLAAFGNQDSFFKLVSDALQNTRMREQRRLLDRSRPRHRLI